METFAETYLDEVALEFSWSAHEDADDRLAEDLRSRPEDALEHLNEALRHYDPDEVPMGQARVRIVDVSEEHTHSVGGYSPSAYINLLLALEEDQRLIAVILARDGYVVDSLDFTLFRSAKSWRLRSSTMYELMLTAPDR